MRCKLTALFLIPLFLFLNSCEKKSEKMFTSVSHKRTGINFRNWVKESETFNVLDYGYLYNGAGVAIGDINNDGLADIYFASNMTKNRLYLNLGNFRFKDITDKAGVNGATLWNTGVTMVDINGDGFLDIYCCVSTDGRPQYRKNLLYLNNGNLTFTECAAKYGIDDASYSTHSVFFDYDKDGDLDLFLINHSLDKFAVPKPEYKKEHNPDFEHRLYKNTGGKFVDVTREAGIETNIMNFGLGVAVTDFNNDNWPDIYVCNDYSEQDYLFINKHDGTFSEELEKYFDHISLSSMGNDAADFNNDGYIDLITLDMYPEDNYSKKLVAGPDNYERISGLKKMGFFNQSTRNMLQLNNNGRYFTEIGQYSGVFSTNWSWAPLFCDLDNDGNKDLYITNGYGRNSTHMDYLKFVTEQIIKVQAGENIVMPKMGLVEKIPPTRLKNYIFKNNGDLTFRNVTDIWGDEVPSLSNGAAYADLDNDGDLDIVVSNVNDYAYVYRNNSSEKKAASHFLKVRFQGTGLNTFGIGAKVELFCGSHRYMQEMMPSRGYMSSMNYELVFGTGQSVTIDSLQVIWPDLSEQKLTSVKADQTITLKNSDAVMAEPKPALIKTSIFHQLESKNTLQFKHVENEFNDFKSQILLPHFLSNQGPHIAEGDVNGDGMTDLFFCGAKGSAGCLYIQNRSGRFELREMNCFARDKDCEDVDALFFDADGDNDIDLYVVSGGNEFPKEAPELQDRLYLNDGNGIFRKAVGHLPEMLTSGSCVRNADIDSDGDQDLFVGGRLIPGEYPLSPRSYILENNGKGYFRDVTESICSELLHPGMITDALWSDFNHDSIPDLITVGEWMKIRIFENRKGSLTEITDNSGLKNSEGWWNSIAEADFDKDGDKDYIIGNLGLNSQIKASLSEPVTIYARDFDNNGFVDAIMCQYINGINYPVYSKDDLQDQMPFIEKKFPTYESYAKAGINDIFTPEQLNEALELKAVILESCILENKGNSEFVLKPLPLQAQLSPVYAIQANDFDNDGNEDVILGGNFEGSRIQFGDYDANRGVFLKGDGKGNFKSVPNFESGLNVKGQVRDISGIRTAVGTNILVFVLNNDSCRLYSVTNGK